MFCVAIPVDWLVRELGITHNRHTYKPGQLFRVLIKKFLRMLLRHNNTRILMPLNV